MKHVITTLSSLGVDYMVTGSVASSIQGEPRSTHDVDLVVAILAGRVRGEARRNPLAALTTVAVCSFVGTSVFALSGLVLGDHALPVQEMVEVIGISVLWDVVMAPLLLGAGLWILLASHSARE